MYANIFYWIPVDLDIDFEDQNLTLSNGHDLVQCISLTVTDDKIVEGNETVVFLLSSSDKAAAFKKPLQFFVIQDNDSEE